MSSLIKASNRNYYLQYFRRDRTPQKKMVPLKTKDKRTAEKLRVIVDDLVLTGRMDPWVSTDFQAILQGPQIKRWTVQEAFDEFVTTKSRGAWTDSTRRTYQQILNQFRTHLEERVPSVRLVTDITPDVISEWFASTSTNVTTQHKNRRHLCTLFNWMVKHRDLRSPDGTRFANPASDVELGKLPDKRPRYLTYPEVEKVMREVHLYQEREKLSTDVTWIVPMIRCNVELGFRAAELCDLRWSNVDFEDGFIRTHTSKGSVDRTVPLSPYVESILRRIREERARHLGVGADEVSRDDHVFKTSHGAGRVCPRHLSRRFKKFARLALPRDRAEEVNFHGTRHSAASYLARAGKSAEFVRSYMGHSTIQVSQRYMHLAQSDVHEGAVEVFKALGDRANDQTASDVE